MSGIKLTLLTLGVLIAFAANSVLGRVALKSSDSPLMDPATYSAVRIVFGAAALACIQIWRRRSLRDENRVAKSARGRLFWGPAIALFLYAVCFSFAYIQLNAAAGTLILFAAVQLTMLSGAAIRGEKIRPWEIVGSVLAFAGLVWLLSPSVSTDSLPVEAILMVISGFAWGIYSLIGKGSKDPISDTARNFLLAAPLSIFLLIPFLSNLHATFVGLILAATSGAITSGLGYVLWYTVLPRLTSAQAAAVQLSVPVVAGLGGVLFAGDDLTSRTVIAGGIILSGIALTIRWQPVDAKSSGSRK
ncbi:MAG: DMT family transporter [Fuerstiella sp.]